MKTLILFALIVVASLAKEKTITTLKEARNGIRIIDGQPAQVGQFPWQVALLTTDSTGTSLCGGSLIDNQWVLTAAHCADGASSFNLYFGRHSLGTQEEGTVSVASTEYVVHPNYDYQSLNYDVALIRLPQPVTYNERIRPVRLPEVDEVVPVDSQVSVSGWGQISDQPGSISDVLNYANLTVISNTECTSYFTSFYVINATVCATGSRLQSTCNGDSGGPLVLFTSEEEATLHGVVSFVSGAGCTTGYPSGYVRVQAVRSWIREATGI